MKLQKAKAETPAPIQMPANMPASKPHAYQTHTDRLPMVYRAGALDAATLPSVANGIRTWPDGRKEVAHA